MKNLMICLMACLTPMICEAGQRTVIRQVVVADAVGPVDAVQSVAPSTPIQSTRTVHKHRHTHKNHRHHNSTSTVTTTTVR